MIIAVLPVHAREGGRKGREEGREGREEAREDVEGMGLVEDGVGYRACRMC